MVRFAISRLLMALLTIWLVVTLVFFASRVTGDPAALLIPYDATPEIVQQIRAKLGLDQSLVTQYLRFLGHAVQGDFGVSYRNSEDVLKLIRDRLPASAKLTILSLLIAVATGLPLGVLAAARRNTWIDHVARAVAFLGQSIPSFFLGMLLIQIVASRVSWLPAGGDEGFAAPILPSITLAAFLAAAIIRLLRSSLLDVLQSEFVRMARMKGLPERQVVWKHALKNALLPVLAVTGMYVALSVTVAVVVEVVFAWPGLGRLTYDAIINRDLSVLQAVVIIASAVTILISLLIDWLSALIDPRLRSPIFGAR
jgi:peptide/nickel transport system permease protein